MSDELNIENYLNEIPSKQNNQKKISLYNLMKKNCPNTVRSLQEKIYGKKPYYIDKERKWYAHLLNYLVTKEILSTEKEDTKTYHNVNEEYKSYFTHPVSSVYSQSNCKDHLILYKETAVSFLIKCGICDNDGNERIKPKDKKKKNTFFEKHAKKINIVFSVLLLVSIVNYILMIGKYGLNLITPFLINTCLFGISLLITAGSEKK